MTKIKTYTVKIEQSCKDGCGNEVSGITEGALRRELCKSFPDFSITVDEVRAVTSMKPGDAVPVSRELIITQKDDSHVALICKAFVFNGKWYDGTNIYAKRQHVWERTLSDLNGNDIKCYDFDRGPYDKYSKQLFMPTDAEIQAALDEFKKKGWHAQYDSDVGYYAVFEGTRALGEYQARHIRNLF